MQEANIDDSTPNNSPTGALSNKKLPYMAKNALNAIKLSNPIFNTLAL